MERTWKVVISRTHPETMQEAVGVSMVTSDWKAVERLAERASMEQEVHVYQLVEAEGGRMWRITARPFRKGLDRVRRAIYGPMRKGGPGGSAC